MNICILTHTFPRNEKDVAAAFMKEFADGLCDNGHKVVVVTPFDSEFARKGDKFKIILYKYIWPDRLHCIGYSKTMDADISLRKKAYFLLPFMLFFGIIALWKAVKKEKIDQCSLDFTQRADRDVCVNTDWCSFCGDFAWH